MSAPEYGWNEIETAVDRYLVKYGELPHRIITSKKILTSLFAANTDPDPFKFGLSKRVVFNYKSEEIQMGYCFYITDDKVYLLSKAEYDNLVPKSVSPLVSEKILTDPKKFHAYLCGEWVEREQPEPRLEELK